MEMERINDHTIRVMIENEDLQDRGTSVRDLLSDHGKIESFFYNLLSEIDTEHDFVDNDKVSFQILPNRDGLELFISRVDGQSQISDIIDNIIQNGQADDEQIDEVSDTRRTALGETDSRQSTSTLLAPEKVKSVYEIGDFEELIKVAKRFNQPVAETRLYQYKGTFYLSFDFVDGDFSEETQKDIEAVLNEFAQKSSISEDVLAEHGTVVFNDHALEQVAELF
ncbi:adaptor protein MecA [Leuconostocaceae bacterium ESL0723]|nr:adaptor protein MecA [Lactobacillaceae bacterium L1_55_11]WEV54153.1 adaptor protein MecA [Leuconostocaceae bacterium ESL0723]